MGSDGHVSFGASLYSRAVAWEATIGGEVTQEGVFGAAGKKRSWIGQQSMNGSVTLKYDRDMPPEVKAPVSNTQITLKLYDDYVTDAAAFWSIPAKVTSSAINCDGRTGAPTEVVINFVSDGAWTAPTRA